MERILNFIFISVVGGGSVAVALTTLVLLLPGFMGRCQQVLDKMPGRAFVVGLVNFLFFFTVALVALQIGQAAGGPIGGLFNLIGLAVAWFLLGFILLGAAGLVVLLNERRSRPGSSPANLSPLLLTSLFLMVALFSPVIGWFIITPLLLLTGLGAAIITLVQRRSTAP